MESIGNLNLNAELLEALEHHQYGLAYGVLTKDERRVPINIDEGKDDKWRQQQRANCLLKLSELLDSQNTTLNSVSNDESELKNGSYLSLYKNLNGI